MNTAARPMLAERFRVLGAWFASQEANRRDNVASAMTWLNRLTEAGKLVATAFHAGALPEIRGLANLVAWSEDHKHKPPRGVAKTERNPLNLFVELVGNHIVRPNSGSTTGEILPTLYPDDFPPRLFLRMAEGTSADDRAEFLEEERIACCHDYAKACGLLATWVSDSGKGDSQGGDKQGDLWSKPDSPKQWGRVFGFSSDTFIRRCQAGTIRHQKHNCKSYSVHVEDLPASFKPMATGQK